MMSELGHNQGDVIPAMSIMHYAFTEMLNNAIDHSGGTKVWIEWWENSASLSFRIRDDGIGAFENVKTKLGLEDNLAAIQEISKGKTTTQPAYHTGEGIFFTSRAVDLFQLEANEWKWAVDTLRSDQSVGEGISNQSGTTVTCEISASSQRALDEVFAPFTDENYEFARSRISIKMFELGVQFISRSEAKRLLRGLDRFREVEVDFSGIESVGQGFVDELLRVWPSQYPNTRIIPMGMNRAVAAMVNRGFRLDPEKRWS
jgi:anti-sigma regulatory factor (Ser/Thr protein kinase)